MLGSMNNVAVKADSDVRKLSIPDNFYFSTVTGQNPGDLIFHGEKVRIDSLSLESINFAKSRDF